MAQVEMAPEDGHHVQFYGSSTQLAKRVTGYLRDALDQHGAAIAVARHAHLSSIASELASAGLDADDLISTGRLQMIDADDLLENLLIGERIDPVQFHSRVGALVRSACTGRLHVYGEMVDLLRAAGRATAMFELESLWGELRQLQPFSLLCGYRLSAFDGDSVAFDRVVACHHGVTGTDRVAVLGGDTATARTLAELEQRAHSLQFEVNRRTRFEALMAELIAITSELAQAHTSDEIARVVTERVAVTLDAKASAVWTMTEDGCALALLAASADARAATASLQVIPIDSDSPFAVAARTNQAIFLGSVAEFRERFPAAYGRLVRVGINAHLAFAILPLWVGITPFGTLCFTYSHPRHFDEADRNFKTILSRHLALALERIQLLERERAQRHAAERAALAEKQALEALARAYREEREAHILADEATRAREEIISVVSHDLRNPVGLIMMAAASILNVETGDRTQRTRMAADRIHRQAMRMARLIEDLVDFAGIQAGRLELDAGIHAPDTILTTTSEIFGPIAEERGLTLATEVDSALPSIRCDPDRAVQVLSNLVSNALKVTPKGGAIAIGAQPRNKEVVFYVRDTGPGIEPDDIPNLFERYWRGKESTYKGTGLGLSIARGIVDAHGGRIWAESQVGSGSVFYFSLSPAN